MEREKTCCFTGHRPQKLAWGFSENHPDCEEVKRKMTESIKGAIQNGYDTFMCGMALGADMYFAECVLALKSAFPQIALIAAIPCKGQEKAWMQSYRARYASLCAQCDQQIFVTEGEYERGCMQKRNRYMVDRSSLLICLYHGSLGGTRSTVQYAKKKGLKTVNLLEEERYRSI